MKFKIAIIEGDGIGPEIISQAVRVLDKIANKYAHTFEYNYCLAGGSSIDVHAIPLTDETLAICKNSDSILLGAVGGPKWDNIKSEYRPEKALLRLRSEFELFANLRPAKLNPYLKNLSPLKESFLGDGFDIMIVRELIGDVYFGEKGRRTDGTGYDIMRYNVDEVSRIARTAFEIARKRSKKLCSVDKANVLETSRLWRETVIKISEDYPDVNLTHMYVDNAAMQLIRNPSQFDVILTGNLFGDILSDELGMITGSIGMLASASINNSGFGMYEPIHGSAPDIAGKGIANPIAAILSVAMMLKYSFSLETEALSIENAVSKVLKSGFKTADISDAFLGCSEITDKILEFLD